MKKSSKLFSFLAVLLCAFMLFGSVASFQRPETVVEAASSKYEKVVSFDTIKNLKVSAENNYYVEYGEYPQSGFKTEDNNKLRDLMSAAYGAAYSGTSIDAIYNARTQKTNPDFTYDASTGYFTAKRTISLPSGAVIKYGEKIYEYISGVNAREKYPVYAVSGTSEYRGDDKNTNLRSAKVHSVLDTVEAGTYYGSSYTKCDCTFCGGECYNSASVKKGNYGSTTKVDLTNFSPITDENYSSTTMQPKSGSWLREKTNVVTISFTNPDELNPTTSYTSLGTYRKTYYTFNKHGNVVPYSKNPSGGYQFYDEDNGAARNEVESDGLGHSERNFISSAYSLIKNKLGVSNGQIYQIYVDSIDISNNPLELFKDDFSFKVWVMDSSSSCAYCLTKHNKGKATVDFTSEIKAYGDKVFSTNTSNDAVQGQQVEAGKAYYFKVEPIKWRVIENNQGELTLQSTLILDSMYYNLYTSNGTNFMQSYLRNWLNNGSENFKGYYNVIDTQSSATGRNESIDSNAYRYSYTGQSNIYNKNTVIFKNDLTGNIAALGSKTQEYSSDKPSFFKMAFSNPANADKSLLKAFTETHTGLMAGFSTSTINITPDKKESDKNPGREYSNNYVIVPNSVTAPVYNGTDAIRLEAKDNKVYTDFAAATGLVRRYSDTITGYTTEGSHSGSTVNYDYSSARGTNALLWLTGGYQSIEETTRGTSGRTNFKTLAVAYSDDEGQANTDNFIPQGTVRQLNNETPFNRMDQSAGVLPIIKLDMNKYGSTHYFKQVMKSDSEKASTSANKIVTASGVDLEQNSYLQTIALQSTVNTQLAIHSYEYISNTQLRINFKASGTSWDNNVDYIRISIGGKEEGTNKVGSAVFANKVRYYAIDPSQLLPATDQAYTHFITLYNIDMDDIKLSSGGTTNNANLGNESLKKGDLRVYVSLVTNNETKEYAIKENQIKFINMSLIGVSSSGSTLGTRYLYEGQKYPVTSTRLAEGVYSNWYWDLDCNTKAITAWTEGTGASTIAKSQKIWYTRTGGWRAEDNGGSEISLKPVSDKSISLYYQTELGKYTVNVGGTTEKKPTNLAFTTSGIRTLPSKASDVMYIDYDGSAGTYTPVAQEGNTDNLIKTATENILGGRAGDGSDLTFQVYIKGMFANQFTTVDDLLVTQAETDSNPYTAKGILSFTTYKNNASSNTSLAGTPVMEEDGWTYTMTTGVVIKIANPVKNMLSGSEIVDTVSYDITISNVTPDNVCTTGGNTSAVAVTLILHAYNTSASNETVTNLANLSQDKFTMKMESSFRKTDLYSVTTSTENTESTGKDIASYDQNGAEYTGANGQILYSQESRNSLDYNTKLTADVKFKTGYSLATNAFTQNGVSLPEMSLGFATQVMDDNGYRLSEDKRYPSNYASANYRGSNIRLDALGRQIDFDAQDNLKMYYQTASVEAGKTNTTGTEYHDGTYLGVENDTKFAYVPLVSLHRESKYLGHQVILFIPRITFGGSTYYFDEINKNNYPTDNFNIVYECANFENDWERLVNTWHVAESKESLLSTYANDNLTDEEVFTIEIENSVTDPQGRPAGVMDRWVVKKKGYAIAGLIMSRAQAETEKHKFEAAGDNHTSLYIDAEYLFYNFTTDSKSFQARLVNNSNYEIEYTATKGQSLNQGFVEETYGKETISLTPIQSSAVSYEPWNIYVKSTLNSSATKTVFNDYNLYTVSTGIRSPLWGNEARQYFVSNAGGNAEILSVNGAGYPEANIEGVTYVVYTDASGAYRLYNANADGKPSSTNPATGLDTYIVSYAQPVTVSLYEVNTDDVLSTLVSGGTSEYYKKGDTFIRIEVNNVVSDVLFTFQESSVTEHQYPVRFYSAFGQGNNGYQNFGTGVSFGTSVAKGWELFNTTITSGARITSLDGVLKDDIDALKTVTTASDGTLVFKPYVMNHAIGNNSAYYYLAPIANVAGHNNEGIVAEPGNTGNFMIENQMMTKVNDYQYTLNGNTYYFTPAVYQFAGWKWNGSSTGGTANIASSYLTISGLDNPLYLTSNNDKEFIKTDDLRNASFTFLNSANELHFIAIYQELDLTITFNSWNMTENPEDDGMYDVIAYAVANKNAGSYFTGNSYKGIQYGETLGWNTTAGQPGGIIEETISGYTFNGNSANYYGVDKGWYRQVPNAVSYVENEILGANLLTFANIDAIRSAIESKSFNRVSLWNNRQFYKNANGNLYFTIEHYADGYVAEVYEAIDFGQYEFKDNTNLYRVYETSSMTVTNGFDAEKFMASNIPTTVLAGQDLTMQFRLDSAYSDALIGKDGDAKKVAKFIESLSISTATRYNIGTAEENHTIQLDSEHKATLIESTTEAGEYYFAIVYTGTGDERIDYVYATISADCRTITITILGVIANVEISPNYTLPKNRASVTFLNPKYDKLGQAVSDGAGVTNYGVFVLTDKTGATKTLTFTAGGETSFILDDVNIVVTYEDGYRRAVVAFDYGYSLRFTFTRNAAFSSYLSNNRPFAVCVGEDVVGTFSNTAFDAENSEVQFRYQAVAGDDATSQFLMMSVTRSLVLNWTDIKINTYKLNGNVDANNNKDYYTATLNTSNVDANDKKVAIYNETLDVVFELKEAYTSFVPTLMYGSPRDLIVFAHRYPVKPDGTSFAAGDSQVVYYAGSEVSNITLRRVAEASGRAEHFAYEWTDNGRTRYYRVYFSVDTEGTYAGYYRVTWANDSASTENTLGYIKYDELNNKYMFKSLETKADITAELSSHYKDNNGQLKGWSQQYKNTYSITLDKNFVANDAYTVTAYEMANSNNEWPEATLIKTSAEDTLTIPTLATDADSVQLINFKHGDKVRFRVKMNDAFTQTLPNFLFLIAQKNSNILDGSNTLNTRLIPEITQAFTMPLSYDVDDPNSAQRKRVATFTIGNLSYTITQIFTYDTSFDGWNEFVEEAGIKNTTSGKNQNGEDTSYDANEYLRYSKVTYVIDIEMKDSFSLSNNPSSTYTQNKYYIIFNKYTEADGKDFGPLKFVSVDPTKPGYVAGKQYYYYQVVNHNDIATNPFTVGGTAPDGGTSISSATFKSSEIAGFTYNGADGENAQFKVKNSAGRYTNYSFAAVAGNLVLYAPFIEEVYNLRLNLPAKTGNSGYEEYGKMYYMASGDTSFKQALTSSSMDNAKVSYTKTAFSVKYQMYSAYDNSEPVFVVSHYGALQYTNAGSFQNVITLGGESVTIDFTVSKVVATDKTTYTYYIAGNKVATVVKDLSTYSNATNRNYVLSTSYILTLEAPIDAGESITVEGSDTTLSVTVNIVKGTNSANNGLNTYEVTLYNPEFEDVTVNHYSSTTEKTQKTLKVYKEWQADNYPTSGSSWTASKTYTITHGTTLTLPTDNSDSNYFNFDSVNGYICNGWYAEKTPATQTSTLAGPGARLTGVDRVYNLYAKYREVESTITPILDSKYNQNYSDLFDDMSTSKGSVKYYSAEGSEAKVTFTLGPAYSQNENLAFAVNNTSKGIPTAIITGIAFDAIKGMYTLTLNYVIGDVQVGVTTEPSPDNITANIYDITFHTYTYTPSYDENGWSQSVSEAAYNVWNSGNIITDIKHGEKLSNKIYSSITLTAPAHEGLTNSANKWAYVIRGEEDWDSFLDSDKFQEVVIATLDDFDSEIQDGIIYEDSDGNQYQMGLFTLNTEITGNMVVFPYYARTLYNVSIVERIESFETGEGVGSDNIVSDEYHGTFRLPYGYPVLSDAVANYDGSAYSDIIAIDDFARDNIGVTSQSHYDFQGYYVNGDPAYRTGLDAILVSEETTEIVIDYLRNRYEVSFARSWNDSSPIATFTIPYGSAITDDTIVDGMAFSVFLLNTYDFADTSKGRHLETWNTTNIKNNFNDEDCTIDRIVCNVTFYPQVAPNRYSVKVQGGEGFTEAMSNNSVHIGDSIPQKDSNGFFALDADNELTIEYIATEGYEAHPYLVFTLMRNGQEAETYNDTYWMAKSGNVTFTNEAIDGGRIKWIIHFNGKYDHSVLRHADSIVISVNQTSSALAVDSVRSTFGDITVDNGITPITFTYKEGDLVTPGNSVVRGAYVYSAQQIPVVEFLYEAVAYGTDFTFIVRIDSKYAKASHFAFTLSAGEGKTATFELDQAHIDNSASSSSYSQYKFTLSAIKESVVVAIDTTSTFVANEFKITYYHAFGGGINDWVVNEVSHVIVTSDTVVSVKPGTGSHAPSPSAIANYTLLSSGWFFLGNAQNGIYNGHLGVNLTGYTKEKIREEFDTFNVQTYPYQADISVFAFYIVDQYDVTPEQSADNKGAFTLPGNAEDGKYSADKKVESMTNAKGYTFTYEIGSQYSKNTPIISVVRNAGADLIIVDVNTLVEGETLYVEKSESVTYLVDKTGYGYTYRKGTNALGSTAEASVYYVVFEDGVYTVRQGDGHSAYDQTPVVATATLAGTKYTVTLNTVNENFSLAVNDEMFTVNAYTIKFTDADGKTTTVSANHGTKLTEFPTAEANFIQKVVYVVTYADGTTDKLSSKEMAELEITQDMDVEIKVELNLILLIPMVVGALILVIVIISAIVKGSRNSGAKRISGRSNMEAFDKLNQRNQAAEANKKSDKPYNPYVDNSKK